MLKVCVYVRKENVVSGSGLYIPAALLWGTTLAWAGGMEKGGSLSRLRPLSSAERVMPSLRQSQFRRGSLVVVYRDH